MHVTTPTRISSSRTEKADVSRPWVATRSYGHDISSYADRRFVSQPVTKSISIRPAPMITAFSICYDLQQRPQHQMTVYVYWPP